MAKENVSLDVRLKTVDETRHFVLEEIKHNELMSEKHQKVSRALNDFEHFLIFISAVSGCVLIFSFASLVGIPVGITNSPVGLKICAITAGIKKCKSVIKKKRKKHNYTVLLAKTKALKYSYINHDEFVSVNNLLKEYNEMKEEIKNPENTVEYTI